MHSHYIVDHIKCINIPLMLVMSLQSSYLGYIRGVIIHVVSIALSGE